MSENGLQKFSMLIDQLMFQKKFITRFVFKKMGHKSGSVSLFQPVADENAIQRAMCVSAGRLGTVGDETSVGEYFWLKAWFGS